MTDDMSRQVATIPDSDFTLTIEAVERYARGDSNAGPRLRHSGRRREAEANPESILHSFGVAGFRIRRCAAPGMTDYEFQSQKGK
jgi:hypothetical protein